jgi:hypothetical protein
MQQPLRLTIVGQYMYEWYEQDAGDPQSESHIQTDPSAGGDRTYVRIIPLLKPQ